jgi:diamine N-acetyltransferase
MKFRKLEYTDLKFLNEVRNSFAENFLHDSRIFTLRETESWFEETKPDYWIILREDERIGYFRLSNYSKTNKNIYIGADLHEKFHGKGYALEAYKKFMVFLFEEYDLHKISLEVLAKNHKALHLYKKIGFVTEGTKRQEVLKGNEFIDSIIMSILKKEFYNDNN